MPGEASPSFSIHKFVIEAGAVAQLIMRAIFKPRDSFFSLSFSVAQARSSASSD